MVVPVSGDVWQYWLTINERGVQVMKLVKLIAREITDWPDEGGEYDVRFITQDQEGDVQTWEDDGPLVFAEGYWDISGSLPVDSGIIRHEQLATDHATAIVTREMWEAERERMMKPDKRLPISFNCKCSITPVPPQPDWSKAPGGYPLWLEYLPKVLNRSPSCKEEGGEWVSDAGDKYNTLRGTFWTKPGEDYYRIHERPASPKWTGEGLPPVGTVCEVWHDTGREVWHKGVIVGHHPELTNYAAVAITKGSQTDALIWSNEFRPIRTPREKWIDLADAAIHHGLSVQDNLGDIWDAGLAKLPEDGE